MMVDEAHRLKNDQAALYQVGVPAVHRNRHICDCFGPVCACRLSASLPF